MKTTTRKNTRQKKSFITKLKTHSQVTIPSKIRQELNLEEGTIFETSTDGVSITFTPKRLSAHELEVEDAFRVGLEELKKRKVHGPFGSGEELGTYMGKKYGDE